MLVTPKQRNKWDWVVWKWMNMALNLYIYIYILAIWMEKMMLDHWILMIYRYTVFHWTIPGSIFLAMMNPVWPTKYLIFVHISCGYEDAEMIRWWFWEITSDLGQMLWMIACKSVEPDKKMPPEWPSDFSPPWQAARRLQCWSAEGGRVGVRSQWFQIQPCSLVQAVHPGGYWRVIGCPGFLNGNISSHQLILRIVGVLQTFALSKGPLWQFDRPRLLFTRQ